MGFSGSAAGLEGPPTAAIYGFVMVDFRRDDALSRDEHESDFGHGDLFPAEQVAGGAGGILGMLVLGADKVVQRDAPLVQ
jgi:hypothetical protein